jgi:DNA/RNA endonuclease G (NUC1)
MKSSLIKRLTSLLSAGIFLLGSLLHAAVPRAEDSYIAQVAAGEIQAAGVPAKPGKTGWWARSWTPQDAAGFQGMPVSMHAADAPDACIVIRYTRYSTQYDAEFHSPIWGAYTLDAIAVQNAESGERAASNPDYARPSKFFQEPLVVALSRKLDLVAASHGTFTQTYDPRFPFKSVKEGYPRSIQRGHMVNNNAMKCQGTPEQGQVAQIESFSVANIVPQMAACNSPTWAALEQACFDWAKELGQVWLLVGPIYRHREAPTYICKLGTDAEQVLPSPDALWYVVIGKRNGRVSAIGFIIPHEPVILDYHTKAVSVDEVERETGINFMPDMGEPNPPEAVVDPAWLKLPAPNLKTVESN